MSLEFLTCWASLNDSRSALRHLLPACGGLTDGTGHPHISTSCLIHRIDPSNDLGTMMDPSKLVITQSCLALRPNTQLGRITTRLFNQFTKGLVFSPILRIV